MRFVSDAHRRAVFASMSQRPWFANGTAAILQRVPVRPSAESKPGDDIPYQEKKEEREEKETPDVAKANQAYRQYLEQVSELRRMQSELEAQRLGVGAAFKNIPPALQAGYQSMAPQIAPAAPPTPPEAYEAPAGLLEQQYEKYLPIAKAAPEVLDIGRGIGQAAKGGLIGGAIGYGGARLLGMGGGEGFPSALYQVPGTSAVIEAPSVSREPWRTAALVGAAGALPGIITSARELSDIPAVGFEVGKELVRSGLEGISPYVQIGGQLVELGTVKAGEMLFNPWTYGPSIHDLPGTLEYPPYYAKKRKPVPGAKLKTRKGSKECGDGFTEDDIDSLKTALSEEFGFLKFSNTQVNQYDPRTYEKVAIHENPDQLIEASQSSAFYDPRADKLHIAIMPDKLQTLRSVAHDLAHSMGHFKDPGINEGMAEWLAVKLMSRMGVPKAAAEAQVGYTKEYGQVQDLVGKYGENSVKQVFMTTHKSDDLAKNMMFDQRVNPSPLASLAPGSKKIIDFDKTAKQNGKRMAIASRFKEASFNIDEYTSNRGR